MKHVDNVINLADRRPHAQGEAKCLCCGHVWTAVASLGVIEMECPECGTERGVWTLPFCPEDGVLWECLCGNIYFMIVPDGLMCAKCGREHDRDV